MNGYLYHNHISLTKLNDTPIKNIPARASNMYISLSHTTFNYHIDKHQLIRSSLKSFLYQDYNQYIPLVIKELDKKGSCAIESDGDKLVIKNVFVVETFIYKMFLINQLLIKDLSTVIIKLLK